MFRLEKGASGFRYLAKSSTLTLPGVDDAEGLRMTMDAMAIVGMSDGERQAVLQTVATVLHLGNVTFATNDDDISVPADAAAQAALSMVATLLMVGPSSTAGSLVEQSNFLNTSRGLELAAVPARSCCAWTASWGKEGSCLVF